MDAPRLAPGRSDGYKMQQAEARLGRELVSPFGRSPCLRDLWLYSEGDPKLALPPG